LTLGDRWVNVLPTLKQEAHWLDDMALEIITDENLDGIKHGFFTRKGGASSGIYAGLNCGTGSQDQCEIVRINRDRVADAMGGSATDLVGVHQIHSPNVVTVTKATSDKPKADAMVTAEEGVILSILTADCQPILFADRDAGVIGAAHAGWKGTMGGVIENTLTAMENLGARADNITAVIGPSISQRAYEVGPEFFETFTEQDPAAARFFVNGVGDRLQFDLPAFGLAKLRDAGVARAAWTRHCTYSDPDRFFSYRRSVHQKEKDYGRLISAVLL